MQSYEKIQTKQFELVTQIGTSKESLHVIYDLLPSGRTLLMDVFYKNSPLDTAKIASPNADAFTKELYSQIKSAIRNNATEAGEEVKELPVAIQRLNNIYSHFNLAK